MLLGLLFVTAALAPSPDGVVVTSSSDQSAHIEASTVEVVGDFRLLEESGSGSGSGEVMPSPSPPPSAAESSPPPPSSAPPPFTPDSVAAYGVSVTVRVFDYDLNEDDIKAAFAAEATSLLEAAGISNSEVTVDDVIITGARVTDGDNGAPRRRPRTALG